LISFGFGRHAIVTGTDGDFFPGFNAREDSRRHENRRQVESLQRFRKNHRRSVV